MNASERNHFAVIARAMEDSSRTRRREALELDPVERMRLGLRLAEASGGDPAIEAELDRRALGQAGLHARWRRIVRRRK